MTNDEQIKILRTNFYRENAELYCALGIISMVKPG